MKRAEKIIEQAEKTARDWSAKQSIFEKGEVSYPYLVGTLQFHIRDLCAELEKFNAPACPSECHEFEHGHFTVHFSYEGEYDGSYEEPSYPEQCEIIGVYINGYDMLGGLSDELFNEIEQAAYAFVQDEKRRYAEDRYDYMIDCERD